VTRCRVVNVRVSTFIAPVGETTRAVNRYPKGYIQGVVVLPRGKGLVIGLGLVGDRED
jgi:hypothetical protein